MMTFWIVALLLSLLAAVFVIWPVFVSAKKAGGPVSFDQARSALNVEIFKERLAELEASRAELVITDEVFNQLKLELEQDLLSNVHSGQEPSEASQPEESSSSRRVLPLVFAAGIPLLAFFFYADWGLSLGSMKEVVIAEELEAAGSVGHTQQDMVAVIRRLKKSLEDQPENDQGWMLLARSLSSMGQYEQSADAYKRLLGRYPQDYLLRSYYAEMLFMADARQVTPRVRKAIDNTLALDPDSANVLEILGTDAFMSGDYASAIGYFERVVRQEISPERKQMLQQGIDESRKMLGDAAPVTAVAAPVPIPSNQPLGQAATKAIDVRVEIDDNIPVDPGDTVFVFARAAQGPPMPLAIERTTVSDLPKMVRLDDTMSMIPEMNILTVGNIRIVARVSKSGRAEAAPGDYQAISDPLVVDSHTGVVKLRIADLVE
jgi:cytochrome c-type biogenesis protein CcmH